MTTSAKAFPENALFLTVNGDKEEGTATAPAASPAFILTLNLGATALPEGLFPKITTSTALFFAICSIAAV